MNKLLVELIEDMEKAYAENKDKISLRDRVRRLIIISELRDWNRSGKFSPSLQMEFTQAKP